ncbi:hypothetical protein KSF_059610 [Reticulibacter mediterranei]|uniref:Uncharacterized protein n=1 Tax=Reticulibacter mediterranei TaxID=2778369 RepID=A0A8J3IL98_9CHLR|nr:hypothetical protein KSF_059610 [Reticulibacter mediterranei]
MPAVSLWVKEHCYLILRRQSNAQNQIEEAKWYQRVEEIDGIRKLAHDWKTKTLVAVSLGQGMWETAVGYVWYA